MSNTHRSLNTISRILFVLWILDEGRVFPKRNDPVHVDVVLGKRIV